MSSSQQVAIKTSRCMGYSSPRNLEKGLQMLPLTATYAAAAGPSGSSSSSSSSSSGFAFSGLPALPALPAAEENLFSPMVSPRGHTPTSPYPTHSTTQKHAVPSLALGQLSAPKPAPKPASKPLPVVVYKPKPKPVDVAFGYRVAPAASPRDSRGKGSVLDGSGTSIISQRSGSPNGSYSRSGSLNGSFSRRDSRTDTEPGGMPGNSSSREARSGGSRGDRSSSSSRIPTTPRSHQADAAAFSSSNQGSSSSSSSSRIPKAATGRGSTTPRNSNRQAHHRESDPEDVDTIYVDCAADGQPEAARAGRSGKSGGYAGKGATFTLSCAISAVFNSSSNNEGSEGMSDGGMSPGRMLQNAAAAISRSLMSSVQQGAGYAAKQQHRSTAKAAPGTSSSSSSKTPSSRPAAAATAAAAASHASSGTAATPRKAAAAVASAGKALALPAPPSAAAAKAGSSKPAAPRSNPATSSLSIVQLSPGSHTASPAAPTWTSTALTVQDTDTSACLQTTTAAAAGSNSTTIFMQLQGTFPEPSKGSRSRDGLPVEDLFASLEPSEAGSSEAWRSASEKGSWRSDSDNQSLAPLHTSPTFGSPLAPTAAAGAAAAVGVPMDLWMCGSDSQSLAVRTAPAAPIGLATAAGAAAGAPIDEALRFHSAASWPLPSSDSEDVGSTGAVEEWPLKQQQQQQQQQDVMATSNPTLAAAAAAAGFGPTAAAAAAVAAVGGKVPLAEEREVMLTISPRALPFLAARALSQTPVRLVITADAVWGDTAAFTAAPSPSQSPRGSGGRKTPRMNPIKAVKRVLKGQQQTREGVVSG